MWNGKDKYIFDFERLRVYEMSLEFAHKYDFRKELKDSHCNRGAGAGSRCEIYLC